MSIEASIIPPRSTPENHDPSMSTWRPSRLGELDPAGRVPAKGRPDHRGLMMVLALGVLLYSAVVVWLVAITGDIGLRCVFGVKLKDDVPADLQWNPAPREGPERRPAVDPDNGKSGWIVGLRRPAAHPADAGGGEYGWGGDPPARGMTVLAIGGRAIQQYPDYIRALFHIRDQVGKPIEVRWRDHKGHLRAGEVIAARRPMRTYLSAVWFLQELVIFV